MAATSRRGVAVAPFPQFVHFRDPDGQVHPAVYHSGRWRGLNRWRAYELRRRRSRQPFLELGQIRVPVTMTDGYDEEPGPFF